MDLDLDMDCLLCSSPNCQLEGESALSFDSCSLTLTGRKFGETLCQFLDLPHDEALAFEDQLVQRRLQPNNDNNNGLCHCCKILVSSASSIFDQIQRLEQQLAELREELNGRRHRRGVPQSQTQSVEIDNNWNTGRQDLPVGIATENLSDLLLQQSQGGSSNCNNSTAIPQNGLESHDFHGESIFAATEFIVDEITAKVEQEEHTEHDLNDPLDLGQDDDDDNNDTRISDDSEQYFEYDGHGQDYDFDDDTKYFPVPTMTLMDDNDTILKTVPETGSCASASAPGTSSSSSKRKRKSKSKCIARPPSKPRPRPGSLSDKLEGIQRKMHGVDRGCSVPLLKLDVRRQVQARGQGQRQSQRPPPQRYQIQGQGRGHVLRGEANITTPTVTSAANMTTTTPAAPSAANFATTVVGVTPVPKSPVPPPPQPIKNLTSDKVTSWTTTAEMTALPISLYKYKPNILRKSRATISVPARGPLGPHEPAAKDKVKVNSKKRSPSPKKPSSPRTTAKQQAKRMRSPVLKFGCTYPNCPEKFKTSALRRTHLSEVHSVHRRRPLVICPHCQKVVRRDLLESHVLGHTGETPFLCEQCGKAYNSRIALRRHMAIHTDTAIIHRCEQCPRTFLRKDHLADHLVSHLDNRPFMCELCSSAYKNRQGLVSHQAKVHSVVYAEAKPKSFKCLHCDKMFSSMPHKRRHEVGHHGTETGSGTKTGSRSRAGTGSDLGGKKDPQHCCEHCDKKFAHRYLLQTHLRDHTGERPYKCALCPKTFKKMQNYKLHAALHSNLKTYKCPFPLCGEGFPILKYLYKHKQLHREGKIPGYSGVEGNNETADPDKHLQF